LSACRYIAKKRNTPQFSKIAFLYHQRPMANLPKLWALIREDLRRARNLLPHSAENQQSLAQYSEFLEHNELELACDALEESAGDRFVSAEFWMALRDAATKMQLQDHPIRQACRNAVICLPGSLDGF
jgi:hypothetical protein